MGATSLTEAWDAGRASSQNHFMLGQIVEWFYRDLAGIGGDPTGPGFRRIIIRPQPVGDVTWVKASYESVRGKIAVIWNKDSAGFHMEVMIPPGSIATVYVPAKSANGVKESGGPIAKADGVKLMEMQPGRAVLEIKSGRYRFDSASE
jgi:hypothetical protein